MKLLNFNIPLMAKNKGIYTWFRKVLGSKYEIIFASILKFLKYIFKHSNIVTSYLLLIGKLWKCLAFKEIWVYF